MCLCDMFVANSYSKYGCMFLMFVLYVTVFPVVSVGLPVPIVAISVGIQHDLYGTSHL